MPKHCSVSLGCRWTSRALSVSGCAASTSSRRSLALGSAATSAAGFGSSGAGASLEQLARTKAAATISGNLLICRSLPDRFLHRRLFDDHLGARIEEAAM